jgi:hypothetical protein
MHENNPSVFHTPAYLLGYAYVLMTVIVCIWFVWPVTKKRFFKDAQPDFRLGGLGVSIGQKNPVITLD